MAGESLSNSAAGDRQWPDYGFVAPTALFRKTEYDSNYEGIHFGNKSSQACAVQAVLWELVDGEAGSVDNDSYWSLKNQQALLVTAGFRLYAEKNDSVPQFKADTEPFIY